MIPLPRSIGAILKMVASSQSADAVVLYEYRPEEEALYEWNAELRIRQGAGKDRVVLPTGLATQIREIEGPYVIQTSELLQGHATCVVAPVSSGREPRVFLYVAWRRSRARPDLAAIGSLAEALTLLLQRGSQKDQALALMSEVTRLQSELADWKIAERTAGLIPKGRTEPVDSEVVREHIARVLKSCEETAELTNRIEQLKAEVASRQRIALAKTLVQRKHGLTEQQAYLVLQRASRRARRSLLEVAEETLAAEGERLPSRRIA